MKKPDRLATRTAQRTARFKVAVGRTAAMLALIALSAATFYSSSSSQISSRRAAPTPARVSHPSQAPMRAGAETKSIVGRAETDLTARLQGSFPSITSRLNAALMLQAPVVETLTLYAADCVTPKNEFNLGETICARAAGIEFNPFASVQRRLWWADVTGYLRSTANITAAAQNDTYTLPTAGTTVLPDGTVVNNRGTWKLYAIASDGTPRNIAQFTVSDAANPTVDLTVYKQVAGNGGAVAAGSNLSMTIFVANHGPNAAQSVVLTDDVPVSATFVSITQDSGPAFNCANSGGTTTCTRASLAKDAKASFTVVYNVSSGTPDAAISTPAEISSATTELHNADNSTSAQFKVAGTVAPPTCTVSCPADITTGNDPGQGGAVVTFGAPTVFGDCGDVDTLPASGSFFAIGSSSVTVTTGAGQSCSFMVTVNDTEAPVIDCPEDIVVSEDSPGSGSATVNYTTSATDNSGNVTITCDKPSGNSFSVDDSPHTVTCVASDAQGLTSSCTFLVTVTGDPSGCSLTPPADIVVNNDAGACGANVTYDPVNTSGESCGTVTCDRASGSLFPVGTTTVKCKSSAGPSTTFKVTVNDTSAPVPDVASLPHITRECAVTLDRPTATDNCLGQIVASSNDPLTYTEPGTYTVHWLYEDGRGNSSTQEQTVTVTGDNPPVPDAATLPTVTGECAVTVTDVPTATDNCSGQQVSGTTTDPLTYTEQGTFTITWTFTDESGNTSTQPQTVVVDDVTAPTITDPPDVSVSTGPNNASCLVFVSDAQLVGATADDNCSVNITRSGVPAGNMFPKGPTVITYTAEDAGGNTVTSTQTVTVTDDTPPTLALNGASTITWECHVSFVDPGATATDACDTSVPVTTSGSVNADVPGTYTITYNATDAAGNAAAPVTRTVNVVDTIAPTLALNGPSVMTVECHTGFTDPGATASDSCAGNLTNAITVAGSVNPNVVGTYTLVYSVSDGAHTTTATRTVNVVDTTAPVVSCPANIVTTLPLNSSATSTPVNFSVSATDSCAGSANVTTSHASGSLFPVGTTTVTTTATDPSGNTSSCSFNVTVLYNFTGFFQPIGNLPVLNSVNAGRAIPIKFSLSGNKGLNIFAAGSPASGVIACNSSDPVAEVIETVTAGSSSLSYDSGSGQYHYVWKTESSWAGTCRQLVVGLNDGSTHRANFKFK
ncbi:MAG TPA: immunoglobulin-like domain-containing protein [Pyrinomonadaceae bacterium]|nr:immunoglobulin-like domain-containing protein [Pyrinomonadaceae bacterium]